MSYVNAGRPIMFYKKYSSSRKTELERVMNPLYCKSHFKQGTSYIFDSIEFDPDTRVPFVFLQVHKNGEDVNDIISLEKEQLEEIIAYGDAHDEDTGAFACALMRLNRAAGGGNKSFFPRP